MDSPSLTKLASESQLITITDNNELVFDVKNAKIWSSIFKFIYSITEFDHIKYREKEYYLRKTMWYDRCCQDPEYDPDIECKGYMSCEEGHNDEPIEHDDWILVIPSKPITYIFSYDSESAEEEDSEEELQKTVFKKLLSVYNEDKLQDLTIKTDTDCILWNRSGVNDDHRGSDHCKIKLDYHEQFEIKFPVTFNKLIDACYRIKSHKEDKWYELFSSVSKIQIIPKQERFLWNIKPEDRRDALYLNVSFDHGS